MIEITTQNPLTTYNLHSKFLTNGFYEKNDECPESNPLHSMHYGPKMYGNDAFISKT